MKLAKKVKIVLMFENKKVLLLKTTAKLFRSRKIEIKWTHVKGQKYTLNKKKTESLSCSRGQASFGGPQRCVGWISVNGINVQLF